MMKNFKIGNKTIYLDSQRCFIIAEIGINHMGSFTFCKRMIKAAAYADADAVKLQTINIDESYLPNTKSYKTFKNNSLNFKEMLNLLKYAKKIGIEFLSTPGDVSSYKLLKKLKVSAIKISSGLMTNLPLIEIAAKDGFPLIISTGMAKLSEVDDAVMTAKKNGCKKIAILKCTSIYPAPDNFLNLDSIKFLKEKYHIPIGYSDHVIDDLAAISSVAIGGTVLEKHFTLNNKLNGADHKISMMPNEFKKMVEKIRRLEKMKGRKNLPISSKEKTERKYRHRYLVAKRDIIKGEKININNIAFKRLKSFKKFALKPKIFFLIRNKKVKKNIKKNQVIKRENIFVKDNNK